LAVIIASGDSCWREAGLPGCWITNLSAESTVAAATADDVHAAAKAANEVVHRRASWDFSSLLRPLEIGDTPMITSQNAPSAVKAAELFEKLAQHGHGISVMTKPEFDQLIAEVTETKVGRELIGLLKTRRKARKQSRERLASCDLENALIAAVAPPEVAADVRL